MAESHDDFLARQHAAHRLHGRGRRVEAVDQLHRRLVGTAVQGTAQRTNGTGDAGVDVRQGRSAYPRSERRGVELVFRVENQRHVEDPPEQVVGRLALERRQEMSGHRVLVGVHVDAHAVVAVAVPVVDDGRQHADEPVGGGVLVGEVALGFEIPQGGASRAHDVHRVRGGGDALQDFPQRCRQSAQTLEFLPIRGELSRVREFPAEQQVRDFLERGGLGEIVDPVTPVRKPRARPAHRAERGLAGALTPQARTTEFVVSHRILPHPPIQCPPADPRPETARPASPRSRGSRGSRTARPESASCRPRRAGCLRRESCGRR